MTGDGLGPFPSCVRLPTINGNEGEQYMGNLVCQFIGHKPVLVVFSSNRIICQRCRLDLGYGLTPGPAPPPSAIQRTVRHWFRR